MKHFRISNLGSMYRRDRNKHDGGVMFYINENIPCKSLILEEIPDNCKIIFIEFSIKTQNGSVLAYKPPSQNYEYFLGNMSLILNKLTCKYDNIMLMGNLNLTVTSKLL